MSIMEVPASECLSKNSLAPINVLKKFARWYCKSRCGRLATNPNLKGVTNILEKFRRLPATHQDDELRKESI